jgi:hypothetical protein
MMDEQAIDEFFVSVAPVHWGWHSTDSATSPPRALDLQSVERFEDGVVQLHYRVPKPS